MGANAGAIKGGQTYVEAYLENAPFMRGLNQMERSLKAWGTKITSFGALAVGAGAAIATPLAASLAVFMDMGGELDDVAQRTGITVEALSELSYAAKQGGTDLATLEGGAQKMHKFLNDAAGGSKAAREAILELGFSLAELQGMTPDQQMIQLGKRIAEIADPAERTARMMQVFGKSGVALLPMMNDIDALAARARDLGLVIEGEDAAAAAAFGDILDDLWMVLKKGAFSIGAALAPALQGMVEIIVTGTSQIARFIDTNRGLVVMVASAAAGLVAGGVALMAFGGALTLAGSIAGTIATVIGGIATAATTAGGVIISAIGGAMAFIATPIGLTVAAVAALAAGILYFSGMGSEIMNGLGGAFESVQAGALSTFETLRNDGSQAFEGIKGALAEGDFGLAAQILWDTLKLEWTRGVAVLQGVWNGFKSWFYSIGIGAFTGAAQLFNNVWSGVEVIFSETTNALQAVWEGFTGFITRTWNSTIGFISKAWVRLKAMFTDIDVDAEVARIDAETKTKNEESKTKQNDTSAARQERQQQERKRIADLNQATNDELERQMEESMASMVNSNNEALEQAERDLEEARRNFDDSTQKGIAASKAAEDRAQAEWDLFGPEKSDKAVADPNEIASKISTTSTFDASVASRLGAGNPMAERTAKATERTAKATEDNTEELQKLNDKKPAIQTYS